MKKFLGIIGGLGPEATAYFYKKVIKMTDAKKDQDHIDMVILHHATIPNRNDYIIDNKCPNPIPYFIEDIKTLENMGASLISIPCNTAYYFYDELQKSTNIEIMHLIKDTVNYIKKQNIKKVGIWGTSATIGAKIYQKELELFGIKYYIPNKESQEKVMHIIYDNIKAGKPVNTSYFNDINKEMREQEVDAIIMGCTELSILKEELKLDNYYIDPLEIEAEKIIKYFGKKVVN